MPGRADAPVSTLSRRLLALCKRSCQRLGALLGWLLLGALLVALAMTAPRLLAQEIPPAAAVASPTNGADNHWDQTVTFSMRDANIRSVVQWIAEQTQKQVVLDPRVQGKVSLVAEQPMTIAQAYQVFLAMLDVYGYAASDQDGILRIYPAPLAKGSPKALLDDFTDPTRGGQVMHLFSPTHVQAEALADLLKPLLGQGGHVAALADSNALLIADSESNVERLVALIQQVDSRGVVDIDAVALEHAVAEEVAKVVSGLVAPASAGSSGASAPEFTIAADRRSNTVLLSGNPAARQRARALVAQLDRPVSGAGATRVVYLRYLSAEEVAPVLRNMSNTIKDEVTDIAVARAGVNVEASKSTNALVLSGPPLLLDDLEAVIERLDVRRAQVLVEAVIVEVSTELGQRLGVEWSSDLSGDGLQGATRFDVGSNAAAVGNLLEALGSGLTLGYYRHGSIRALINALATTSQANILSTPSVMTLDNQPAEIMVGSNIPIITGQVTGAAAEVTNPFTTFERQDIGISLKITPQINHGDAVTLDIVQEVETVADVPVGSNLNEARDIVTNKRSITTKVLVENQDVLVLGGLISDEDQETVSKVPVLGDMPLVGKLFRTTSQRKVKRNLMVFIHPVIVETGEVADLLSRRQYDEMRRQQQKAREEAPTTVKDESTQLLPEFETFRPALGAGAAVAP